MIGSQSAAVELLAKQGFALREALSRVAELEQENKRLGDEMVARVRIQQRTDDAVREGPDAIRRLIAEYDADMRGEGVSDGS